jgi:hypothetical protein
MKYLGGGDWTSRGQLMLYCILRTVMSPLITELNESELCQQTRMAYLKGLNLLLYIEQRMPKYDNIVGMQICLWEFFLKCI